jgi:translation initiation factor IF-2
MQQQKIRINDLARELEVKSKVILDILGKVGVTEKKPRRSSSTTSSMANLARRAAARAAVRPSMSSSPRST